MTLQQHINEIFKPGMKLTNIQVREQLQILYDKYNIDKKPKSTDLRLFGYKIKRISVKVGEKWVEGTMIMQ